MFDNNETVSHMYDSALAATEKQSRVIVVNSLFIGLIKSYLLAFLCLNIN